MVRFLMYSESEVKEAHAVTEKSLVTPDRIMQIAQIIPGKISSSSFEGFLPCVKIFGQFHYSKRT